MGTHGPRPVSDERRQASGAEFTERPTVSESDKARGHFLAAIVARFDNDYETATRETVKAVAADPKVPRLRAELAELYVRGGELAKAREQAAVLVTLQPGEIEPRLFAGRVDIALQEYQRAIGELQEVLVIKPDNEEALVLLGALYSRVGDHAHAVEVLRRATAISPESFIANFGLGKSLAATGQYEDALRSLKHAARLNASIAELHLHTAFVYVRLGMRKKAIDSFNRAIDFNPQLEQARRQIGPLDENDPHLDAKLKKYESLVDFAEDPLATCAKIGLIDFQRGDYVRAITDFHIVLGARPGEDEIRYWLALAYDKVGDLDGTARELALVSARAPRYVDARLFLSSILEEKGNVDGAIDAVQKLLVAAPDNADGLRRLIALYRTKKQYTAAITIARRLVALDPKNDAYLYGLAWLYDESGDKDKAIATLKQVLAINPQNADALNHLGYTWAEKGQNIDEAEKLIRKALEMHPDNAAIVDSLAWVYYQKKDYAAAVRELEKATSLGGRDPVIVEHLGDVYLKVGRDVDAERSYRDAAARTEDPDQRRSLERKIHEIRSRWNGSNGALAGEDL
ncbi:MAG TPA: tetratricopeptide repeat protein [Candidatus Binatia bacterium]|jgi:tetratricopeptide (TPR) repeat protein